ncbi:unnamed protein product, partial [Closterium sp. Naga37s-1]
PHSKLLADFSPAVFTRFAALTLLPPIHHTSSPFHPHSPPTTPRTCFSNLCLSISTPRAHSELLRPLVGLLGAAAKGEGGAFLGATLEGGGAGYPRSDIYNSHPLSIPYRLSVTIRTTLPTVRVSTIPFPCNFSIRA